MSHRQVKNMTESNKALNRGSTNSMCFREEDFLVVAIIMILIGPSFFFLAYIGMLIEYAFVATVLGAKQAKRMH